MTQPAPLQIPRLLDTFSPCYARSTTLPTQVILATSLCSGKRAGSSCLVSSEHPDLDARLSEVFQHGGHVVLRQKSAGRQAREVRAGKEAREGERGK
eukprot:1823807-Pleurochrysis_carterae.AAC.1